jgi:hypothetical protein
VAFPNYFFFLQYWGLNLRSTPWAAPPSLFCDGFFWDKVLQTICRGWHWIVILLISSSWVAKITGMSHQLQAPNHFLQSVYSLLCVVPEVSVSFSLQLAFYLTKISLNALLQEGGKKEKGKCCSFFISLDKYHWGKSLQPIWWYDGDIYVIPFRFLQTSQNFESQILVAQHHLGPQWH